jgi:hypothetical protein
MGILRAKARDLMNSNALLGTLILFHVVFVCTLLDWAWFAIFFTKTKVHLGVYKPFFSFGLP